MKDPLFFALLFIKQKQKQKQKNVSILLLMLFLFNFNLNMTLILCVFTCNVYLVVIIIFYDIKEVQMIIVYMSILSCFYICITFGRLLV